MAKKYPGTPAIWASVSRLAEVLGDVERSWVALTRAIALTPDNPAFRAISLITAVDHLSVEKADQHLRQTFSVLAASEAEVSLMYAFAEIALSERSRVGKRHRLQRALEAVNAAFPKARSEWVQKHLRAVKMFLDASTKNEEADPNLLYRAGLPRLAATSTRDPIGALRTEAIARIHEQIAA
ncbi:MAG: hypothetical protein QM756_19355 [Polyangiaceae bacterium]